jgi:hypothetical protein
MIVRMYQEIIRTARDVPTVRWVSLRDVWMVDHPDSERHTMTSNASMDPQR